MHICCVVKDKTCVELLRKLLDVCVCVGGGGRHEHEEAKAVIIYIKMASGYLLTPHLPHVCR